MMLCINKVETCIDGNMFFNGLNDLAILQNQRY